MSIYIALPMMYGLKNGINWTEVPAEGIAVRDNIYTIFLAIAVPLVGMIFLWGFMQAQRGRTDGEY